jgi:hypothetical protein
MPRDYKISEETAKEQMQLFYDYYDLDIEEDLLDKDAKIAVRSAEKRVLNAIRSGRLEITKEKELKIVQSIIPGDLKVEYKELDGQCRVEADKQDGGCSKMLTIAGYLNGLGFEGMKKMKGKNLSTAECLGMLFLQI